MEPFALVPAVRPPGGGRGAAGGWRPRGRRRPAGRGGPATSGVGVRQPSTRCAKKSLGHLGAGAVERYEVIAKMKATFASCPYSTAELCAALDVSPSGLHTHQR